MVKPTGKSSAATLSTSIETCAVSLRETLTEISLKLSGDPPRPTRLVRAIGLDKSLASRIIRCVRSGSDVEFMHMLPSPSGLRIFADRAGNSVDKKLVRSLLAAADEYQELIDTTPGGRDGIDAWLSETSRLVREKREHSARQASFKSMSFLLGHYSETLLSSLFLVPSEDGKHVDGVEIHRRLSLTRLKPNMPMALLSVYAPPEETPQDGTTWMGSIDGGRGNGSADDFILSKFSSKPIPSLEVVEEGPLTTFVLPGNPDVDAPSQVCSAFRIHNGWELKPTGDMLPERGYMLHIPSRALVREIFIAEELYQGAIPQLLFRITPPGGGPTRPGADPLKHYSTIDLAASIEQIPEGPGGYEISGVPGHRSTVEYVLERSGLSGVEFRGWRCRIPYPVPLTEMIWRLKLPGK